MRLDFAWLILSVVLTIDHAMAFNCLAHKKLKKYNFDKVIHVKEEINTPPTTTIQEWYLNFCENEVGVPPECHSDDVACGLIWSKVPDKDPVLTHELHLKEDNVKKMRSIPGIFAIDFKKVPYGDDVVRPSISFQCDLSSEENELWTPRWHSRFNWVNIDGPAGCVKKEYDHGGANNSHTVRRHSGPSWFVWLLICVVSFAVICLVVLSYLNTRGGTIQDFCDDLVDRLRMIVTSLASLLKEILSKVFNRTSSEAGGYGAM